MDTSYYPYAALSCASFLTFYRKVSPAVSEKYFPIYESLSHAKQVEWNTRSVVCRPILTSVRFAGGGGLTRHWMRTTSQWWPKILVFRDLL